MWHLQHLYLWPCTVYDLIEPVTFCINDPSEDVSLALSLSVCTGTQKTFSACYSFAQGASLTVCFLKQLFINILALTMNHMTAYMSQGLCFSNLTTFVWLSPFSPVLFLAKKTPLCLTWPAPNSQQTKLIASSCSKSSLFQTESLIFPPGVGGKQHRTKRGINIGLKFNSSGGHKHDSKQNTLAPLEHGQIVLLARICYINSKASNIPVLCLQLMSAALQCTEETLHSGLTFHSWWPSCGSFEQINQVDSEGLCAYLPRLK